MKLAEMSPLYEDSARRIQRRMEELRLSLRSTEDPECTRQLRRRLLELQPLLRQRLLHNLSRAMTEELTTRQQEMLQMYYYEGLNMTQIAVRLGVNKSTVSRTLCRARRRLHHILQYSL